eukprot:5043080-Prymnesium_polylepis.2
MMNWLSYEPRVQPIATVVPTTHMIAISMVKIASSATSRLSVAAHSTTKATTEPTACDKDWMA